MTATFSLFKGSGLLDPATIRMAIRVAAAAVKDERTRNTTIAMLLIPIALVVMLLASPFAAFFGVIDQASQSVNGMIESAGSILGSIGSLFTGSKPPEGKQPVSILMIALHTQLTQRIKSEQEDPDALEIETIYMGSDDGLPIDNRHDVMALFAVQLNMNPERPEQVAVLSADKGAAMVDLYWRMNRVNVDRIIIEEESNDSEVPSEAEGENQEDKQKYKKVITVDSLSADEMISDMRLTDKQMDALMVMLEPKYAKLLMGVSGGGTDRITSTLTPEQVASIKANLPKVLSLEREAILTAAYSLEGRVKYFWGGKSYKTGWDNEWGKPKTVTAPGSNSTGSTRPFGLDCSGFVLWSFIQAGVPADTVNAVVGSYSGSQWDLSTPITEDELVPGDFAFLGIPGKVKVNHVGIYVGEDASGTKMFAHCSSGKGGVVITPASAGGFKYWRRPAILMEGVGG